MTYKEPLEVLEAVLEKAATKVPAGQWITVNGRHMLVQNSQFHPQHGWVNVTHAEIPESSMGRQSPGVYHGTKGDGTKVDFKEGESTHHAVGNDVYDSESGKKVGSRDATSGALPIPPSVSRPRATVQAGARERAPLSSTGIIETPKPDMGAKEPRVAPAPTGQGRFSTKPLEEEPAAGTHEHFAGEYPGKGKKGSMADLHEHLRANGFGFDHAEGEMNQYGSPTDKVGNTFVYKHPDGREVRMVNTQSADQTWVSEPSQYNPKTGFTSTRSSMRRPVTEYTLQ